MTDQNLSSSSGLCRWQLAPDGWHMEWVDRNGNIEPSEYEWGDPGDVEDQDQHQALVRLFHEHDEAVAKLAEARRLVLASGDPRAGDTARASAWIALRNLLAPEGTTDD